jgi:hypothetical protein
VAVAVAAAAAAVAVVVAGHIPRQFLAEVIFTMIMKILAKWRKSPISVKIFIFNRRVCVRETERDRQSNTDQARDGDTDRSPVSE